MAHSSLSTASLLTRVKWHFDALMSYSHLRIVMKRHFYTSICYQRKKARSTQWMVRQRKDPYVLRAKHESWRCRSAYKLIEMDQRFHILKRGYTVIDCGASPGSWTQVAVGKVSSDTSDKEFVHGSKGKVISVDLQYIEPIRGAVIVDNSDFTSPTTQAKILEELGGELADVVLSDMAPNASGTASLDHEAIIELCLSVLKFCTIVLKHNGCVVCKIWMGGDQDKLKGIMERMFRRVKYVKPDASRSDSAEIYIIGQEYFLQKK